MPFWNSLAFSVIQWMLKIWSLVPLPLLNPARQASLVHHQLPESTQTQVHWVSDAIQPTHPLSSPSPPAFNLSQHQGLFSNESVLRTRWPKYWSFSLSFQYSGLISFRMDWLDVLAVQGTLKSLLQHYNSKTSFFGVQLSLYSLLFFFLTFFTFFTFTSFTFLYILYISTLYRS